MKIKDAKITTINGQVSVSWQMTDNSWTPSEHHDVADAIVQDVAALKEWCQAYKDAYNAGKDAEAAAAEIQNVPPSVTTILNQPLGLI